MNCICKTMAKQRNYKIKQASVPHFSGNCEFSKAGKSWMDNLKNCN